MALESKMFIVMMARIVKQAKSLEEVYETLNDMAGVDGITLKPYNEKEEEEEEK